MNSIETYKVAREDLCPHCHEEFSATSKKICSLLSCGHLFHQKCLDSWLKINPTCPSCRRTVIYFNLKDEDFRLFGSLGALAGMVIVLGKKAIPNIMQGGQLPHWPERMELFWNGIYCLTNVTQLCGNEKNHCLSPSSLFEITKRCDVFWNDPHSDRRSPLKECFSAISEKINNISCQLVESISPCTNFTRMGQDIDIRMIERNESDISDTLSLLAAVAVGAAAGVLCQLAWRRWNWNKTEAPKSVCPILE